MKFKRVLSILLVAVLMIGLVPTFSVANAATYGDLTYEIADGEVTITDCNTSVTSVTIPSEIDGYPVTTIGNYAFFYCKSLESITIPDSVTTIGNNVFYCCYSLVSITIPDSVTTIGNNVFYCCYSLVSITIPDSVITIGDSAFNGCEGLQDSDGFVMVRDVLYGYYGSATSITISESVTKISNSAFSYCDSLVSITIPDSVTTIGKYAFSNCTSIVSITIGDSVTTIGDSAFYTCTKLASITIPDSVTAIGERAFYNCKSLASVTIGDSVTTIGDGAFYWCSSLKTVNYGGTEQDRANITIGSDNSFLLNATWNYHQHIFDNACDTSCNTCDFTRATQHSYTPSYDTDNHFDKCTVCGDIVNSTAHEFDNGCDTTCDNCDYIREQEHSWSEWIYSKADNNETRTCGVCGESETRDITENPTYRPDEHMPFVTLNESGNGVALDHNKSWATRVYWGNIGDTQVEYKWFDEDFRLLCGTDYFVDYSPKAGETYNFTKPGWYRFVVKAIRTGTSAENYTYSELVYDFYYDGEVTPTVPTITELGNNQVKINTNGTAIKKFYYGNIGQTNIPYSWFNSFWNASLVTKTYTSVFDNRDGRIITLQTKGYYNIIIVDTNNNEYVYTVYADENAPVIKKVDNTAVVDIDILKGNVGTKATISKLYYGYVGTEDKEISGYTDLKANATGFSTAGTTQGTTINLKNEGYYKFLAVVLLSNGKNVEIVYTIQN